MDANLSKLAMDVFQDALDQPEADRAAWLAANHGGDRLLIADVERLLRADAFGAQVMPTEGVQPLLAQSAAPARIGRYRIIERIGEGGMGEVFVAARDDGLFDHEVAIKRVRPSLLPETARAMFQREQRALAKLSHHCIAQLFDGGVDDTGAPYLIMELVRGPSIDDHVRDKDLSPRQVVTMLAAVCDAVQHAHQNLIVHADLKPANILVNEAGDPKVVDFGVARILRDVDQPDAAQIYPRTPGYASPQREAGASPTPADDVFSLGAILRTLLTGAPPDPKRDTGTISSVIESAPAFSSRAPEWRRARANIIRGDLDAIARSACAPDVSVRYQSAAELAADLRAWLEFRPLSARKTDRTYVALKFLRRRRLRVIAGAVALAGLVAALGVTTLLYTQADRARAQAEARFTEVRGLAKYLLYDVYDRLERTSGTLAMRRDVARVAQAYLEQLSETPSAPDDVHREVIDGLIRVSDLQAGRSHAYLGEPDAARDNLERAQKLMDQMLARHAPTQADQMLRARIALHRASLAMNVNQKLVDADRLMAEAASAIRALPPGAVATQVLRIEYEVEASTLASWEARYADGATHSRAALAVAEALPPDPRQTREVQLLITRASSTLAEALYYQDRLEEAEATYVGAAAFADRFLATRTDDMQAVRAAVEAHWALGTTYLQMARPHDALAEFEIATRLAGPMVAFEPDDEGAIRIEGIVLTARAQALAMTGRFEEGVALLQAQIDRRRARFEAHPRQAEMGRAYAISLTMMADLHADRKLYVKACAVYDQAKAVFATLASQGQLSEQDRASALKSIVERQTGVCLR